MSLLNSQAFREFLFFSPPLPRHVLVLSHLDWLGGVVLKRAFRVRGNFLFGLLCLDICANSTSAPPTWNRTKQNPAKSAEKRWCWPGSISTLEPFHLQREHNQFSKNARKTKKTLPGNRKSQKDWLVSGVWSGGGAVLEFSWIFQLHLILPLFSSVQMSNEVLNPPDALICRPLLL